MEIKKVIEASRILLEIHDKSMAYMKLIKLLYLADRISFEESDRPITFDRYVSMKHGPVLSNTLALINSLDQTKTKTETSQSQENADGWERSFEVEGYNITVIPNKKSEDQLPEEEFKIVNKVGQFFKGWDVWEVVEFTHNECHEWMDPHPFGVQDLYDFEIQLQIENGVIIGKKIDESFYCINDYRA